jgi:hypothetical protein
VSRAKGLPSPLYGRGHVSELPVNGLLGNSLAYTRIPIRYQGVWGRIRVLRVADYRAGSGIG